MEIVTPAIEEYIQRLPGEARAVETEMEARAADLDFPIVGPLVGRLLYQLARLSGARRVLELGSGFGYSAYWFGRALEGAGELILTDFSRENLDLARDHLERGGIRVPVRFHTGDALETLEQVEGEFDIVYNDVDKHQYPEIFRRAAPRVRPGGLFISDNVLWKGRVAEGGDNRNLQGVLEHNRLIFGDPDFFSSIVPLRDGVSISLKRG